MLFRVPLNPTVPADAQASVSPAVSVIVIIVLLNVALMCAIARVTPLRMRFFMREANTLCSKSATTALTALGLELKAVIEQLREQVQNVE